jgi:CDP-glycerol glycerophosphotransferase (TagB/SpsB family)
LAQSFNQREFQNIHVVGYPIYDEVKETQAEGNDWKIKDKAHKRIIWAPHHSIEGSDQAIKLSTFLLFAEDMLEFKDKYKDKVQFAFKPHPQLKPALYKHKDWGKERTDAYYKAWEEGDNSTFVGGAYIDLFKSSDGMIHDSHSFTVEYLYVDKPVMFMTNYDRESQCNAVGKKAFAAHYHGTSKDDIQHFIEDVVIGGKDTMAEKRHTFYNDILVPPNGKSVAENIINEITTALNI